MRYIYSENEFIERAPERKDGDPIVIINRATKMPEIGIYYTNGIKIHGENYSLIVSPYYWEIAWP